MSQHTKTSDPELARRIRHAGAYPFARPACSYLFSRGGMHPLPPGAEAGRIPVIASGSNAAPNRLAAKFGDNDGVIPVTTAVLHDFAVVFAGHFTAYGAIPATLSRCPKARTSVWITWLTPSQLLIMHRSEGVVGGREVEQRYDYVPLDGIRLHPERGSKVTKANAYLTRRMLAPKGRPIRFAETSSTNCSLEARPQRSTLNLVHQLLDPGTSFTGFMARVLSDANQRHGLFQALTPHTIMRK